MGHDDTTALETRSYQLEIFTHNGTEATWPLKPGTTLTIGRSQSCQICIDHRSVSREHARLTVGPAITVTNLRARNGTSVRGRALGADEEALVAVGDLVEVGSVQLRIVPTSGPGELPAHQAGPASEAALRDEVEALERQRIEAALADCGGNQSEAARRLKMSRGALLARLRAWGIYRRGPRSTRD